MVCVGSSVRAHRGDSCRVTCLLGRWSINKVSGGSKQVCLSRWCTIYELCYAWLRDVTNNQQLPFLTAEPCNLRRKVASAQAMMVLNEKKAAKPTWLWTRWDIGWLCMSRQPMNKTAPKYMNWLTKCKR